jgi:4-hydroxybenzoate polyprenyltransferase
LGRERSILAGKLLHSVTIVGLVLFGIGVGLGVVYYCGVVVAAILLAWEHHLVRPTDLSRLDAAFFRMNGIISIVVLLGALGERLL